MALPPPSAEVIDVRPRPWLVCGSWGSEPKSSFLRGRHFKYPTLPPVPTALPFVSHGYFAGAFHPHPKAASDSGFQDAYNYSCVLPQSQLVGLEVTRSSVKETASVPESLQLAVPIMPHSKVPTTPCLERGQSPIASHMATRFPAGWHTNATVIFLIGQLALAASLLKSYQWLSICA